MRDSLHTADRFQIKDSLLFAKMWSETQLPNEMSTNVKAGIRLYQVLFDAKNGVKNSFAINELSDLSKDDEQIKELIVLSSGMIMIDSFEIALSLLELIDSTPVRTYVDDTLFLGIVLISMFKCKCISDIDRWFKWIQKQLDDDSINQMDDSEYSDFFIHAFDLIRNSIKNEEIDSMEELIDELDYYAITHYWKSLHVGCLIKKIHLYGINKHDYEAAKELYNTQIEEKNDPVAQAHLCYKMGLLALDNKDYIFAEDCFNIATSKLVYLSDFDKIFCLASCAISYSHNSIDVAKIIIDQALERTNSYIGNDFSEEMQYKLNFERVIAYYLTGDLYNAIESIEYLSRYLKKYNLNGSEHLIVITLHCFMYIITDLISHKPLKRLNENEEYTAPYMGILWNKSDPSKFQFEDIELRNNSLHYILALLFDYYGYNESSNKCIEYIRDKNGCNMISSQIATMAVLEVYYIYKLWEISEFNLAVELIVKVVNSINNSNLLMYTFLKCTFYLLLKNDKINSALSSIKGNVYLSDNTVIKNWIEAMALLYENRVYEDIIRASITIKSNSNCFKATSYIIATEKANYSQLITLYLCIFSAFDNVIFNDIFWMNNILIPLMKRQLSSFTSEIDGLNDIINGYNCVLNGYKYNCIDIKRLLKQCVSLIDDKTFEKEWLKWLE